MNISLLGLPKMLSQRNPELVEAYELAFAHDLTELLQQPLPEHSQQQSQQQNGFSVHHLIEFFGKNLQFTQSGFYPGFSQLVFDSVISDARSASDTWLVSVLLKITSLGVSDIDFLKKVEKLIDSNLERFSQNSLIKLIILICSISQPSSQGGGLMGKHRDYLIRKTKLFNPVNI